MYFQITDLIWLIVISAIIFYWWRSKGIKEFALKAAQRHCEKLNLQLLDNNVALRGLWVKRGDDGNLHLWRSFNFEFSSLGDDRYQGRIVLLGNRVEAISLDPHRVDDCE